MKVKQTLIDALDAMEAFRHPLYPGSWSVDKEMFKYTPSAVMAKLHYGSETHTLKQVEEKLDSCFDKCTDFLTLYSTIPKE